jgi:hypothetical protein
MSTTDYYQAVTEAALKFLNNHPSAKVITGADFGIEPADMIVAHSGKTSWGEGEFLKVNATTAEARPPFEWLIEVSTDDGLHYLLFQDKRLMRAVRKELFVVPDDEAEKLLELIKQAG